MLSATHMMTRPPQVRGPGTSSILRIIPITYPVKGSKMTTFIMIKGEKYKNAIT